MSFPRDPDFAVIYLSSGTTPETFTLLCGIDNISLNETANTNDVFRRDCAKPGATPKRRVRVTSTQWDLTASGVANVDMIPTINQVLGVRRNYRIDLGLRDGTDAGQIIGRYYGPAVMTANNKSFGDEGTAEITMAGEDDIIWTEPVERNPAISVEATTALSDTELVFEFTADRAAPVGGLSVNFNVGGSALSTDMDSGSLPVGPVTIAAGMTSATLTVTLAQAAVPGRTLVVLLGPGAGYDIGVPSSAVGEIDS